MKWFAKQKLNVKFTEVIGLIVFIPILAIYLMLFHNLKQTTITQVKEFTMEEMRQTYGEIQKTVDLCNMSTQMFLNNQNLSDFLAKLMRGDEISAEEIVNFYQNDIAMLERLVNSNPYLYRIRVYAQSDDFSEMMPILFHHQRMEELTWASTYVSGQWQMDYSDNVFGSSSGRSVEHVMALVTDIQDYELGTIGVLEVAVDMSRILPQLFETEGTSWGCFLDEQGTVYTGMKESEFSGLEQEIAKRAWTGAGEEEYCEQLTIGREQVIMGCVPVKELSGYLVGWSA